MSFDGFDRAAIAMLADLPDLSADEYAEHKTRLTVGLTKPGAALIADVAALDADLTVVPRSSVSPLHRDLRFAPAGAARYKDHLLLTTWEGVDKKTSPTFWVRIDAERAGFASGIGFSPAVHERWRTGVGGDAGAELADALDTLVDTREAAVAGEQVKKVPAPFSADHPRADLLRHTGFQVRFVEPLPACVGTPHFADWCNERLDTLLPVHRWLIANLTD